jgi:periodic tryptophan protein 2
VGDKGAGRLLLRRWVLSRNRSLDGVLDKLHSRGLGEGGVNLAVLDAEEAAEAAEREERAGRGGGGGGGGGGDEVAAAAAAARLPGVASRALRPEVRCKGLCFSPTGRAFSAATTEGLLLYDADAELVWEPLDLQEEATPEGVARAIASGAYARALLLALALGEPAHLSAALLATPLTHVPLVATTIPLVFLGKALDAVAVALMPCTRARAAAAAAGAAGSAAGSAAGDAAPPPPAAHESSPHLHLLLVWARALLQHHAVALRSRPAHFAPHVRALQRALGAQREGLGRLAESTRHLLAFLCTSAGAGGEGGGSGGGAREVAAGGGGQGQGEGGGEDSEEDEGEEDEEEEEEEEDGAFSSWRAPQAAQ